MCVCVFVQGDGREEVVACAWDGQTYIIDHNRMVVRFQFDENVNAFCAGVWLLKKKYHIHCLLSSRLSVILSTLLIKDECSVPRARIISLFFSLLFYKAHQMT